MSTIHLPTTISLHTQSLDTVKENFEAWRKTREKRSAIPQPLWDEAISLVSHYSINKIARTLRLNYATLKEHIQKANAPKESPDFFEVPFAKPANATEWSIEMGKPNGGYMRICIKNADIDLTNSIKAFWSTR